ncbi:MAG TPA: FtsX-like permease family protein [Solirubrobacteraceae bacterium]|nr:FtsX-like permease family protein [Solirubrobacteraceae bacterium]
MRLLGIFNLYRVRARRRLVPELLAALGIAIGVALLFASEIANTSLNGSVHQLTRGLVGSSQLQLLSRTYSGFDERLLREARELPGVRSATPVLEVQANVLGPRGRRASVELIGADPRTVHLGGTLLQHFSVAALARQSAFALPAPIATEIGSRSLERLRLQIGAETTRAWLGLVLHESDIGVLVHSPVALAPLAYAQQVAKMPHRITRVLVRARPGQEGAVEHQLAQLAGGRVNVETGTYDASLFDRAAAPTNQSTAVFAAISALVGFLLAFNAILITVPGRRRIVSDLRWDGYTPGAIRKVLLVDALVLGIVGSGLGLFLGNELSLRLFRATPGYLSFAFAIGEQRIVSWQSITVALVSGLLAACLGILVPFAGEFSLARRLRRTRGATRMARGVSAALLAGGTSLAGLACLLMTVSILLFAPGAVIVGIVSLTAALLLLLPALLRGVIWLVDRTSLVLTVRAPFVAASELRETWPRTVAIAATGAIAVFGIVAIDGAHADLQRGLDRSAKDVSRAAEVWAFPPGLNNLLATATFRATAAPALARVPGVGTVDLYRGSFLDYGQRRVWISAPPNGPGSLVPPHQIVKGNLALADARLRQGGWAVVSDAIAKEHHLRIGDPFTLPAPAPIRLRVAALCTNIGWPPGAIVMSATDYAKAWASSDASAYEVFAEPGVSSIVLRREVQRALGSSSGLVVETAREREVRQRTASRQGLSRLTQISTLVLIAAVLAMVAAIGNMIWLRRRALADLKLDGAKRFGVWRILLLESTVLVGAGCSVGAVFGLFGQLLGSHAILGVTGFPVVFSFGFASAVKSLLLVTAVAVAITAIPGYFIAKTQPDDSD